MGSLLFSSLIAYVGCRSLPLCGCYDSANGMVSEIICKTKCSILKLVCKIELVITAWLCILQEFLVPQNDPVTPNELVCTWQGT